MKQDDTQLLTPRDLAQAIGTSESSVRRWLDAGSVKITRTAGGHRRIALSEAVRFIRDSGATVVRPEILNLNGIRRRFAAPREDAGTDVLYDALLEGRAGVAKGLLASWYAAGRPLADIFDRPVRAAMEKIGQLWNHDAGGILQEHRATAACVEAILHLRDLLVPPPRTASVAIGGSPEGDHYLIPTLAAATTLREAGYRDRNYGANTPLPLLADAARKQETRIVWISISAKVEAPLRDQLARLADELAPTGATLVIGGRLSEGLAPIAANVRTLATMAELSAFATASRRK